MHIRPYGVLLWLAALSASVQTQPAGSGECVRLLEADDGHARVQDALARSLTASALNQPPEGHLRRTTQMALDALSRPDGLRRLCDALTLERTAASALLTGYYRPVVPARRARDGKFRHPLYGLPEPALRGFSRAQIDRGALDGKVPVLAWLSDPVETFFIHVQGSALLAMPDAQVAIGYAGSNDKSYTSIGALLAKDGRMRLEDVTMASLKAYLRDHPDEREGILHANERYIYFRFVDTPPVGSMGVSLTDARSVAADPAVYPPGTLLFLRAVDGGGPVSARIVVVQDRGTAIVGPGRLDLFVGSGEDAGKVAGALRQRVEIFTMRAR